MLEEKLFEKALKKALGGLKNYLSYGELADEAYHNAIDYFLLKAGVIKGDAKKPSHVDSELSDLAHSVLEDRVDEDPDIEKIYGASQFYVGLKGSELGGGTRKDIEAYAALRKDASAHFRGLFGTLPILDSQFMEAAEEYLVPRVKGLDINRAAVLAHMVYMDVKKDFTVVDDDHVGPSSMVM